MKQNPIEVIFFDLGRVLVDFDLHRIAERLSLASSGRARLDSKTLFERVFGPEQGLSNDFNAGRISPETFYFRIAEEFDLSLPFDSFARIWAEIFTENREVTRMIEELAGHFRLFLLSNTDPIHFKYIVKTFPVLRLFESWILSYEVGVCKPDEKIYQTALSYAGVSAGRAVYIDDVEEYIRAAEKLGIRGIHFTSEESLKKDLTDLLPFHFTLSESHT